MVLDGLAFANGVALAADESFVAVAETAAAPSYGGGSPVTGPAPATCSSQDLPGYPDNIARGSDGLIWVTIASPSDPLVERLQRGPMSVRRRSTRIPEGMQPKPKHDRAGAGVRRRRHAGARRRRCRPTSYHMVTGVREHEGRVWLGSLDAAGDRASRDL